MRNSLSACAFREVLLWIVLQCYWELPLVRSRRGDPLPVGGTGRMRFIDGYDACPIAFTNHRHRDCPCHRPLDGRVVWAVIDRSVDISPPGSASYLGASEF